MEREGDLGFGGGRDRFRRDYHHHHDQHRSRFEEKSSNFQSRSGRFGGRTSGISNKTSNAPPSRHLWVGNLSHSLMESDLTSHFLRFGELESVAFQPGRSYAFLNFAREEDAIDAIEALQGFPLAGNPLRIEFAKADKSLAPSYDDDHSQRREERSGLRESSFSQDLRARHSSADQFYAENSSMTDKNVEPSPVLWIGFPASLNVDEMVLRRAFSPFGEIEKITAFPGRSYAFVRFKSVKSACNAKDTLHGKLFGNPRVHICFAKNENGSLNSGRNSINVPPSPHFASHARQGSFESFGQDRKFGNLTGDPRTRSPQLFSNLDSGDFDRYSLGRNDTLWTDGSDSSEHRRFVEVGSELGLSQDMYEYQRSPTRGKRGPLHDFSQRFSQTSTFYDEPWDAPEDAHFSHGAKKLKTDSFPPDKELPEYPFSARENEKYVFPRMPSDISHADFSERKFDVVPFGNKHTSDRLMNVAPSQRDRSNHWKESNENLHLGSGSLILNSIEKKRLTPESGNPSLSEWKWEGTIAKGGTPVCRARCFPVGKVLDLMLPEFLDCTARTSLDMLSKHYYQAMNAWVVFFVPGTDADIAFYNEFMRYLEEKQRAAVAKLDEYTTLFLVPPSNFSEKVLKVPGRLSISGVVLRLENPGSNMGSFHQQHEREDANLLSFLGDTSYPKPSTPSVAIDSSSYFPEVRNLNLSRNVPKPATTISSSAHFVGADSDNFEESRTEYPPHGNTRLVPNWYSSHLQNSVSDTRTPSQVSASSVDSMVRQQPLVTTRTTQEITAALQPEQLVQLASSLLGQQTQPGSTPPASAADDLRSCQNHALQHNLASSVLSAPQSGQVRQLQQLLQQTSNVPAMPHQIGAQGSQHPQSTDAHEADSDPQKRLQATLQLAAALLQQIQGK